MRAVDQDDDWLLHYENAEDKIEVKRTIKARELWNELTIGARDWAEPGCLFWDTIRRYSSSDRYPGMGVVSTNPCAEEPLEPYGDCCIGSINLAAFVSDSHTPAATLDVAALERAVRCSPRSVPGS
jgi:ribonucleoside-diphosphate reductase alpha chain